MRFPNNTPRVNFTSRSLCIHPVTDNLNIITTILQKMSTPLRLSSHDRFNEMLSERGHHVSVCFSATERSLVCRQQLFSTYFIHPYTGFHLPKVCSTMVSSITSSWACWRYAWSSIDNHYIMPVMCLSSQPLTHSIIHHSVHGLTVVAAQLRCLESDYYGGLFR